MLQGLSTYNKAESKEKKIVKPISLVAEQKVSQW